jgi:hypothetical protein
MPWDTYQSNFYYSARSKIVSLMFQLDTFFQAVSDADNKRTKLL